MKHILIALDYDPTAQKIAEIGFEIAKSMGATISLLHVITDPVYYASSAYSPIMGFGGYMQSDFVEPELTEQIKESSMEFLEKSKTHLGDKNIKTSVIEGNVADCILETADTMKADFIVMGTHSRRWLEKILMGSVAEKILAHAHVPVLFIPTGSKS